MFCRACRDNPGNIATREEFLSLVFMSDPSITRRGFYALYAVIDGKHEYDFLVVLSVGT